MLDPSDEGSETEDVSNKSPGQFKKTCADCGTSKTPLWRGGPAGPKSMSNACGIRSRKERRDASGLIKAKKPRKGQNSNNNSSSSSNSSNNMGDGLKQRLMALGRDVMMRKRSSSLDVQKQRKKLGEEEQAAQTKIQKVIDVRIKGKNPFRRYELSAIGSSQRTRVSRRTQLEEALNASQVRKSNLERQLAEERSKLLRYEDELVQQGIRINQMYDYIRMLVSNLASSSDNSDRL